MKSSLLLAVFIFLLGVVLIFEISGCIDRCTRNEPKEVKRTVYNLPDTLGRFGSIWVKRKFIQWHTDTVNNTIYTTDSIYYTQEILCPFYSLTMESAPIKRKRKVSPVSTTGDNSPAIQSSGDVIVHYDN